MSTHPFPVRSQYRPAAALNAQSQMRPAKGLGYVPPFSSEQSEEYRISLEGCPCQDLSGLEGNWYFYPEAERNMHGMFDFLNPLNSTLFTIPVINVDVTSKRLILGGAAVLAVSWLLKR